MDSHQTALSRSTGKTEIRLEVQGHEVSVLDGYCSAYDRSRTDVMREILADWSSKKLHEATVIYRVAGVNPVGPEGDRK
jgi:hypothetical protein